MSRICKIFTICTIIGGGPTYRSAGACPPRTLDHRENRTPAKAFPIPIDARRGTGPRPTVKREAAPPTVARGPVPRERSCAQWLGEGQALARPSTWSKT